MEIWPTKIDWSLYEKKLAEGEFAPGICTKRFRCEDPPDAGSMNAALSDFFPLLIPHLPQVVCNAIGPFISAVAMCGIEGWPQPQDGPDWLYDNSRDLSNVSVGQIYSPSTVVEIVRRFESISRDELESALARAWSRKSNDSELYNLSSPDYFDGSSEFLEYILAWFSCFREAAADYYGIGISGG